MNLGVTTPKNGKPGRQIFVLNLSFLNKVLKFVLNSSIQVVVATNFGLKKILSENQIWNWGLIPPETTNMDDD